MDSYWKPVQAVFSYSGRNEVKSIFWQPYETTKHLSREWETGDILRLELLTTKLAKEDIAHLPVRHFTHTMDRGLTQLPANE